jgi:nicotinamide-nucleotide amidase
MFMPGVPRELRALWESTIGPRIVEHRDARSATRERIARRIYRVFGRGESHIADDLVGLTDGVAGASIHYQVSFPETLVKLVVRDTDGEAAARRLLALDTEVRARLGGLIYGVDDDRLPATLGRALRDRAATLATAESCTGGDVGRLVTSIPGSSDYYLGGVIAYADREKVRQLGVPADVIERFGAVSRECVTAMALGARARFDATYAVSVSGIAGPSGGSAEKPVGTVWLAVAGPSTGGGCDPGGEPGAEAEAVVDTKQLVWPGTREQIRTLASYWAVAMVLRAAGARADDA